MNQLNKTKVNIVNLDTIFKESDIVSLHCPLNDDNVGLVNTSKISCIIESYVAEICIKFLK